MSKGKIKCTFAEIYNADGKPVFSFQAASYGKDKVLCASVSDQTKRIGRRLCREVVLTKDAQQILNYYLSGVIKKDHGMTERAKDLAEQLKKPTFWINDSAVSWETETGEQPGVEPEPEPTPTLPKKAKWALAAAAALALLNS